MLDLDTSRIYSCSILPELPGCAGLRPACGATGERLDIARERRPSAGCAGFQPAPGATSGLLNQEEAMDATPARMMMWFAAFPRLLPLIPLLSRVEFLGEMSDVLHSRAPLPLIPPAPFSHTGRRGRLGVLMPETENGRQGLPQKPPPVSLRASDAKPACAERELRLGSRLSALGYRLSTIGSRLSAIGSRLSALGYRLSAISYRLSALGYRLSAIGYRLSVIGYQLSAIGYRLSATIGRRRAVVHPASTPATVALRPAHSGGRTGCMPARSGRRADGWPRGPATLPRRRRQGDQG